jgi:hypothetical protein
MATLQIPGRPFASEQIAGLALPGGIFEIAFGQLTINAHVQNAGHATVTSATVYLEGASDPGIAIAPATQPITDLPAGGARLFRWRADFTRATPGKTLLSFVCIDASGTKTRIVQSIYVTRTTLDARSNTVAIETPEGVLRAGFPAVVRPVDDGCCGAGGGGSGSGTGGGLGGGGSTGTGGGGGSGGGGGASGCGPGCQRCCGCQRAAAPPPAIRPESDLLSGILLAALSGQSQPCPIWYLPQGIRCAWEPTPPYAGQYGDRPFQDLWWKDLLCVVAVVLVMASSFPPGAAGALPLGTGDPLETGPAGPAQRSCGLAGGGAGAGTVATGLVAAAAACVVATGLGEPGDPIRRGQDHTRPGPGERTIAESLSAELAFPEAVALGRPFAVGARWKYQRITTAREYPYAASDVHHNAHVLSSYEIAAPEVNRAYAEEAWTVQARFWDADGKPMTGAELFVQCFLIGPCAQVIRVVLQDDGVAPDAVAGDGTYTALHRFTREAEGLWKYLVIAQDAGTARHDLPPDPAARILGGIVRTHQLTISFGGGTCKLIPDGYIHVIGGLT